MALDWITPDDPTPRWAPDWMRDGRRHSLTIAPLHPNEEGGTRERYLLFDARPDGTGHQIWLHANKERDGRYEDTYIRLVSCLEDAEQIVKAIGHMQESLLAYHRVDRLQELRRERLAQWIAGQED